MINLTKFVSIGTSEYSAGDPLKNIIFSQNKLLKERDVFKRNFSPRSSSPGSISRQETLIGFEPTSTAGILTLTTKLTVVLVTTLVHFKKIYKVFKTSCQKLPRFSSRPLSRGPSAWGRSSCT